MIAQRYQESPWLAQASGHHELAQKTAIRQALLRGSLL